MFTPIKKRAWIEIDLDKVAHNVNEMRRILPVTTKIMGIVKDNAYGHGDVEITKELVRQGVDFFGLSTIEEAIRLRNAGINEKLLLLGYTPLEYMNEIIEYNLLQTVVSLEYAIRLNKLARQRNIIVPVHIKIDTGMARIGIRYVENEKNIDEVVAIFQLSNLKVDGIFSHFAVSDDLDDHTLVYTENQIILFDQLLEQVKLAGYNVGITHLQNTYGILNYADLKYDYVRPGLLHLGLTSDSSTQVRYPLDLHPILSLKTQITRIKTIKQGSSVSYGCNYIAKEDTKVATLSIGYGDGLARALSNKHANVIISDVRCEIIGNICMDQIMVDVTGVECNVDDEVIVIGSSKTQTIEIDELARCTNTINNDVLCQLNTRLERFYIKNEQ